MNNFKYFVVSDTHSYKTALSKALFKAGFRKGNKNHKLIICGDIFDRGDETLETFKYIKSIPKYRRILIKGNHEYLYLELLQKDFPDTYDFSNGTVRTFCQIAGESLKTIEDLRWHAVTRYIGVNNSSSANIAEIKWNTIKRMVADSAVTKWLLSDEWLNYFELNNFIFVHSFIPLTKKNNKIKPLDNWRTEATLNDWVNATWGCPWELFKKGYFENESNNGKILVCGHWSTNDFRVNLEKNGNKDDYSIFISKNLIGLDACTALTGKVNVLVIDNDRYFDQNLNELKLRR